MPENTHFGLIEQLQAAVGPSRELDALIAAAAEPHLFDAPGFAKIRPVPAFRVEAEGVLRFIGGGIMCMSYIPAYTASIDAAVKLAGSLFPQWSVHLRILRGNHEEQFLPFGHEAIDMLRGWSNNG